MCVREGISEFYARLLPGRRVVRSAGVVFSLSPCGGEGPFGLLRRGGVKKLLAERAADLTVDELAVRVTDLELSDSLTVFHGDADGVIPGVS